MSLGSGRYAVVVSEWSGRIVWQSAARGLQSVSWGRERCEMSKAQVEALIPALVVDRLEPWVHLLTVYRDEALVWHGVVTRVEVTGERVRLDAADGSVFFSRRRISINRAWDQHDATQVMRTMVEDACGHLDATGLVEGIATRKSRVWVTASWTAGESMVESVVQDLADQGLVWTVAAGRLLIGPVAATHTTAQITDRDLDATMTIVKDGSEVVTDALVMGKGVWGQWAAEDSPVGLLQSIEKADGFVRGHECVEHAQRLVEDSKVAPRRVELPGGSRLLPSVAVEMAELVPGVRVPVASRQTGVVVGSLMQLTKVDVSMDSGGEKVSVTLKEVSSTDDVSSMPDPKEGDLRSPYERELERTRKVGLGGVVPSDDGPGVAPV